MIDSFKSCFASQMEDFIQYKKALGYSRSSYEKFLALFDRFCLSAFPEERSLTQELVMQWARLRPNETANGLKRRMVAIREFGKYLNAIWIEGYVLPPEMLGPFKPFFPYLFSDEELTAFFTAADNMTPHKLSPYRQFVVPVLFRLLYCCGLRPHEVRLIRCADINLETGSVYISDTKVHHDRIVVMSSDMLSLCRQYDTKMRAIMKNREYFFSSPQGTVYSVAWVQEQFRKCWKKAGIQNFRGATTPRVYDFRYPYINKIRTFRQKPDNRRRFRAKGSDNIYRFIARTPQNMDKLPSALRHFLGVDLSLSSSSVAKAFASCSVVMSK
ncbi:site-specific tyrosine recombinase XerC [Pelotomaculum schinkii]|uniref:Site-specific tyrosine recombinase XerC n=1 Tax=Pelotomaculum schinkii TaxID=78350 RepID=A0A4Y7R5L2_9FIRM|nr:site-specific tyrosine recombinase XerC [Pelotomaculum schinkii]